MMSKTLIRFNKCLPSRYTMGSIFQFYLFFFLAMTHSTLKSLCWILQDLHLCDLLNLISISH